MCLEVRIIMYTITYSLKGRLKDSDTYYQDVAVFTDKVLAEADRLAGSLIKQYRSYLASSRTLESCGTQTPPASEESILEFLILGTLWKIYSGDASNLENPPKQVLAGLKNLRRQNIVLKPGIDFLRGILSTLFLSPDLYDNMFFMEPTLKNMEKLLGWLDATGEFTQEAKRLTVWKEFLSTLSTLEASDHLATSLTFAIWFEGESESALGKYTKNVERYLNEIRPERYWHEDVIFCGRRRVEYHLNMVGAEIMNMAFREDFLKTGHKLLLLPACMRLMPGDRCKATQNGTGFKCAGCTEGCSVFILARLGKQHGFGVAVIPHESSISARKDDGTSFPENTGVIGVACILNLISGGWMLKDMGVPAQCVLLDYCGCRNHWHEEGIPTELNVEQLKHLLRVE